MDHPIFLIDSFLRLLGVEHPEAYSHVTYAWVVMLILIGSAFVATRSIKMTPEKGQNFFEVVVDGLESFMVSLSGPGGRFFFPFIASVFLFILLSNLIGLVPGCFSPTANLNTTLALALCTFVYTHFIGIKIHGAKYIKHFLGPVWWLAPVMLPIELIGHFARVMSLSMRLFGNIFGKETVLTILFFLAGAYLAPLPVLFLGILVSFIQAIVFMLLATLYFVGAMEHAH
jgi:F-type H+-transporting ATPase subunit a